MRPKYPFFIVIDDGGFPFAGLEDEIIPIRMEVYATILRLAKDFGMRIPVCFTMKFLDRENVSGLGAALPYLDELLGFLKENGEHIEMGYHGLKHNYEGCSGEFYCLGRGTAVPEEIQRERIRTSAEIFRSLGMPFPELFVPPCHAWENGVTDRILSEYGTKYLVSFGQLDYQGRRFIWKDSRSLEFLHREEIGVYSRHIAIPPQAFETACRLIVPRTLLTNIKFRRRLTNPLVHSYMTHIGNFMPRNYDFWARLFEWARKQPALEFCKDNRTAAELYNQLEKNG